MDRAAYKSKFSESGWRVFERSIEESRRAGQNYISVEGMLKAFASEESDIFDALLRDIHIDVPKFKALLNERIKNIPRNTSDGVRIDPELNEVFKRAREIARANSREAIESMDILISMSQDEMGTFIKTLTSLGAQPYTIIIEVRALVASHEEKNRIPLTSVEGAGQRINHSLSPTSEKLKPIYRKGDMVRIKNGAFASMTSKVSKVIHEKSALKVSITIFGRSEEIELNFSDVEKLTFAED